MPKIIDGLQIKILKEAKFQTFTNGYNQMTIRSVAKACNIAVGTIYNYFPSKEMLTASFILQDWLPVEKEIQRKCGVTNEPLDVLQDVYDSLCDFITEYRFLFEDESALQSASTKFHARHRELRLRLSRMLHDVCMEKSNVPSKFLPEFIAEALLAWAIERHPFSDLRFTLAPLFT